MVRVDQYFHIAKLGIVREIREFSSVATGYDFSKPSVIRVSLTDRCNYKCGYCDHWKEQKYKGELTAAEWKQVFINLAELNQHAVIQFTGGEPFLRRDLFEIINFARDVGLSWGVITNGYKLSEQVCYEIARREPHNVDVSVDGVSSKTHDQARGVIGSFEKVSSGIQTLSRIRKITGTSFSIRLKATVHKLNISELPQMVTMVRNLGATTVDFSPLRLEGQDVRKWLLPAHQELVELENVIGILNELKDNGAPIETTKSKLNSLTTHFKNEPVFHGTVSCKAPLRDMYVDPSGEARFCWDHPSLGNLFHMPGSRIWSSQENKAQRKKALSCSKHGSNYCATSCLSHRTFTDNITRAIQHAKL